MSEAEATAYPLAWPAGWPRTPGSRRSTARFDCSLAVARDGVIDEVSRLGARYPVISSNVPVRRDGLPYSGHRIIGDPGVAVYFQYGDKQMTFACDRWLRVEHNLRAIQRTIEALRGIERWGASDMMERAFSAFEALPPPGADGAAPWHVLLGVAPDASKEEIRTAWREKIKTAHPDAGGDPAEFIRLQTAYHEGLGR